jgi:septal ring factor EnvC (AmiA/AmiB activator)
VTELSVLGPLAGLSAAVVALVTWYFSDRRKSKAEIEVAEATVQSQIEKKDVDAQDARLLYVQRQVDMERSFHQQQIADRDAEIARQRAELERRDQRITALLTQVDALEKQLADVTRQMTRVRSQLDELAHPLEGTT